MITKCTAVVTDKEIIEKHSRTITKKKQEKGVIIMNQEIFNVIQLFELTTICVLGKADIAELKCKEKILSFAAAINLLTMSGQFFPLKKAILNYVTECFMDSDDPDFLKKPNKEEADAIPLTSEEIEETDIQVLLRFIDNLSVDFQSYLADEIDDNVIIEKTGESSMFKEAQEYIYIACVKFIQLTLKKLKYEVGAFDMKFFDFASILAELYYHRVTNPEHKLSLFELLAYMRQSPRHQKYLDNIKHPAKKLKENEEYENLKK